MGFIIFHVHFIVPHYIGGVNSTKKSTGVSRPSLVISGIAVKQLPENGVRSMQPGTTIVNKKELSQ
jgi:hypothetical protein